jgi:hypothetical protein
MNPQKPKRYLRKSQVMDRYGYRNARSVERAWQADPPRIPPPTLFRGRIPLWEEAVLDEHDAELVRAAIAMRSKASERGRKVNSVLAAKMGA